VTDHTPHRGSVQENIFFSAKLRLGTHYTGVHTVVSKIVHRLGLDQVRAASSVRVIASLCVCARVCVRHVCASVCGFAVLSLSFPVCVHARWSCSDV
jgi:hypothetical protein